MTKYDKSQAAMSRIEKRLSTRYAEGKLLGERELCRFSLATVEAEFRREDYAESAVRRMAITFVANWITKGDKAQRDFAQAIFLDMAYRMEESDAAIDGINDAISAVRRLHRQGRRNRRDAAQLAKREYTPETLELALKSAG